MVVDLSTFLLSLLGEGLVSSVVMHAKLHMSPLKFCMEKVFEVSKAIMHLLCFRSPGTIRD